MRMMILTNLLIGLGIATVSFIDPVSGNKSGTELSQSTEAPDLMNSIVLQALAVSWKLV